MVAALCALNGIKTLNCFSGKVSLMVETILHGASESPPLLK